MRKERLYLSTRSYLPPKTRRKLESDIIIIIMKKKVGWELGNDGEGWLIASIVDLVEVLIWYSHEGM